MKVWINYNAIVKGELGLTVYYACRTCQVHVYITELSPNGVIMISSVAQVMYMMSCDVESCDVESSERRAWERHCPIWQLAMCI